MKMKFIKKNLWLFIIIIGITGIIYPFASQQYYNILSKKNIKDFDDSSKKIIPYEVKKNIMLARAYNQTLTSAFIGDPFSEKEKREGRAKYARMLEIHEKLGYVEIPRINQKIIIKAGTSESVLREFAGHLEGTSLPVGGKNTHTVITAHRGLPTAKLFTDLNKLKKGDVFYITNIKEKMAYKVNQILVVEPSDFRPVKIFDNKDYATLLTCTPYMINSHRLLVRGERISYIESKRIKEKSENDYLIENIKKVIPIVIFLASIILYKLKKRFRKKNI